MSTSSLHDSLLVDHPSAVSGHCISAFDELLTDNSVFAGLDLFDDLALGRHGTSNMQDLGALEDDLWELLSSTNNTQTSIPVTKQQLHHHRTSSNTSFEECLEQMVMSPSLSIHLNDTGLTPTIAHSVRKSLQQQPPHTMPTTTTTGVVQDNSWHDMDDAEFAQTFLSDYGGGGGAMDLVRCISPSIPIVGTINNNKGITATMPSPRRTMQNTAVLPSNPPLTKPNTEMVPKCTFDLVNMTFGNETWAALSKPLVNPNTGLIVVGIEDMVSHHDNIKATNNQTLGFICARTTQPWHHPNVTSTIKTTFVPTTAPIRDMDWIQPSTSEAIVFASDHGLGILHQQVARTFQFQPHRAVCRQIVMDPYAARIASGGFDGMICISALDETMTDIVPINSVKVDGVVGSVAWHPTDPCVVSFTTDNGSLGFVDSRIKGIPRSWQLGKPTNLYAHAVVSEFAAACGFADGTGCVVDLRVDCKITSTWQDPRVTCIGELVRSPRDPFTLAVVGIGGMSIVELPMASSPSLPARQSTPVPATIFGGCVASRRMHLPAHAYKTSGIFLPPSSTLSSSDVFCMTDVSGCMSMFDVM